MSRRGRPPGAAVRSPTVSVAEGPPPALGDEPGAGSRMRRLGPLVRALTVRDARTRYRQSALDVAWGFITPVVTMSVYGVILKGAFDVAGDDIPYLTFAWLGMVVWTFFASGVSEGVPSLVGSADLVSKVYFPREAVPLAKVGAAAIDFVIAAVTVVVVAVVQGIVPGRTAVAAVVPLAILLLWTAAVAVLGSVLSVFLRDVNHAAQLALRVGFFATPVMYPLTQLPGRLRWLGWSNPVAVVIEALRDCVLRHQWPDWALLAAHGAAGAALLAVAVLYTRSVEDRIVDVL